MEMLSVVICLIGGYIYGYVTHLDETNRWGEEMKHHKQHLQYDKRIKRRGK